MTLKQAEQLTGEILLLAPLLLILVVLRIFIPSIMAMVVFFACKWAYDKKTESHLHIGKAQCAIASYGIFIIIGLICAGLSVASPYMQNQPMMQIILAIAATWAWAAAGDIQYSYSEAQRELKQFKDKPPFRCETATADEIRARCIERGKTDEYADFLIAVHRSGKTQKEIASEHGIAPATVKEYKRKRTRELEGLIE